MKEILVKSKRKQKRLHWNKLPVPPKQRFMAACRVLGEVGRCGEDITAKLLGGEVISDQSDLEVTMDVLQAERHLGVEVKMCNYTHEHRPVVGQIARLYEGVQKPGFIMDVRRGVYSLNFYKGVVEKKGNCGRKSKIMSRKISAERRRTIIAQEMQYIYLVDIELLNHLATCGEFKHLRHLMKLRGFCDATKEYRQDYTMLCLTRTFLKGFMEGKEMSNLHRRALDNTYGPGGWIVEEKIVKMRFVRKNGHGFIKKIPVRMIGSQRVVKVLRELVTRQDIYSMKLHVLARPSLARK